MMLHLKNPWLLFGAVLFFINLMADSLFNIPVAEIAISALMFYAVLRQPRSTIPVKNILLVLACVLIALNGWLIVASLYAQVSPPELWRSLAKLSLIPLPILLYLSLQRQAPYLALMIGFLLGDGLFYMVSTVQSVYEHGMVIRDLRQQIPSPALWLFLILFLRPILSKPMHFALAFFCFITVTTAVIIEVRTALLGLALAPFFAALAYVLRPAPFLVYLPLLSMPALPVVALTSFPLLHMIHQYAPTFSNIERGILLEYAWELLQKNLWFGMPMADFVTGFNARFYALTGWQGTASGPHNFYMDVAVAYGLPALMILVLFFGGLFYTAFKRSVLRAPAAAWGLTILALHCTFFGYTGLRRFEIMLIWFALFFGWHTLRRQGQHCVPVQKPAH